jgi:oxidoreductase
MRSKGQTEAQLASLGYKNTIIFRPGYLRAVGGRDRPHAALENFYGLFSQHVLSHLWANAEISTDVLGRATMLAGELGTEGCLKHGVGKREQIGTNGEEVRSLCF